MFAISGEGRCRRRGREILGLGLFLGGCSWSCSNGVCGRSWLSGWGGGFGRRGAVKETNQKRGDGG